jgi:hypothetical protein
MTLLQVYIGVKYNSNISNYANSLSKVMQFVDFMVTARLQDVTLRLFGCMVVNRRLAANPIAHFQIKRFKFPRNR